MGLPSRWKWCTVHKRGTHYDHTCRRHAPNYPDPPSQTSAALATNGKKPKPGELADRIVNLLGLNANVTSNKQHTANPTITITPAAGRTVDFRQARNIPTNVAKNGPPVKNILAQILSMTQEDRNELTNQLADAGF